MKPGGSRKKGARFERDVAKKYEAIGIEATRMPLSGAHSELKGDIRKPHDRGWVDECKNQERIELWKWWEQAVEQCKVGEKPVLHITSNRKPHLVVLRAEEYFALRDKK